MNKIKAFVSAARLRTLPLSIAGIIAGSGMAMSAGKFNLLIFVLALLTTVGFQILSNFANDYGDGIKGTDNKDRIGPERAIQSGALSPGSLKSAIIVTAVLSFSMALLLIYTAFKAENLLTSFIFIILGILAIAAAIKYTVGNSAYGYRGMGDIFVFLFFGLLGVAGSYYLYTHELQKIIFLPAITVGLFSVGVLNLNNMRDLESDKKANKITLAVKMGYEKARRYHFAIIFIGIATSLLYLFLRYEQPFNLFFLLSFVPVVIHLRRLLHIKKPEDLDKELKPLAISTFVFSVLFMMSFNIFL